VPSFLIETYLARCADGQHAACEQQARSAAAEAARTGASVSFDGSIHVPEDELCFFVFTASTAEEAATLAKQAGLEPLRIVEAIPSRKDNA
jgi:hypothetical protein